MLAFAGGVLYLFDPTPSHSLYRRPDRARRLADGLLSPAVSEKDDEGEPNAGLVVPVLNIHAYLLGAIAFALPPWVAVTFTVAAVLLLTGREKLHALARRIELKEIVTAGEFLILTGIVLPLLPNKPVTTLTNITPRQAWLALVVVCTLSYASYLAQRYWAAAARGLWMAALGGLYSSTATTVVLARQAKTGAVTRRHAQAGITLATAIMYLRILVVVAFFNLTLARTLALPLCCLSLAGLVICALQYWLARPVAGRAKASQPALAAVWRQSTGAWSGGDLRGSVYRSLARFELGQGRVRNSGIYTLAAIVGVTDIDPFVLNLAQGGTTGMSETALAAAILIAASSNNILKALYAAFFAGRTRDRCECRVLVLLAAAGVAIRYWAGRSLGDKRAQRMLWSLSKVGGSSAHFFSAAVRRRVFHRPIVSRSPDDRIACRSRCRLRLRWLYP